MSLSSFVAVLLITAGITGSLASTLVLGAALNVGGLILWLILGLIAGFVASRIMGGGGYGLVGDIIVGLIGAFIGGLLANLFIPDATFGFWGSLLVAFVGAILLIAFKRGSNIFLAQHTPEKPRIAPAPEEKVQLSQQRRVQNAPPPKEHPPPTLSIFVSHSSKDDDFSQKLVHDLRKALQSEEAVWYDSEGGLYGGDPWWSRIVSSLAECDVFVVVLSPNSVKSKWVMRELDIAMVEGKRIIPVLYRQCDIRPDLSAIQIISFLEPISYEAAFNGLLQALRH